MTPCPACSIPGVDVLHLERCDRPVDAAPPTLTELLAARPTPAPRRRSFFV